MLFCARCVIAELAIISPHPESTSSVFAVMAVKGNGTSIEYLTDRLQRAGRFDLLEAVADRRISTFFAAEIAGIVKRRPTLGLRDHAEKRRLFAARGLK
jgi:hypothetical protein